MKMSKNKKRQKQCGRPVLVTFYVAAQSSEDRGGSTASSSHHHHHHHHKQQQHHDHRHHSHGAWQRRRRSDSKSQSNRRADLLEYSRQLRASSRQTTATTAAVGVRRDERQRQQVVAVNRLERTMSPQKIRQRCFGGDDWSWKRVLMLVFPFHGNKSRRPRRNNSSHGSEKNIKSGRPAALLVGKLTTQVSKDRRERSGFLKTLMSSFQNRSR